MNRFASEAARYLTDDGLKGVSILGDNGEAISISFTGENISSIRVNMFFDNEEDGSDTTVAFRVWDVAKYNDDNQAKVMLACHNLNAKYRFVKFTMADKDHSVNAELDTVVFMETVGQTCRRLITHIVNVVDEGYPELMRAIWS